jgi:hypothetical protein
MKDTEEEIVTCLAQVDAVVCLRHYADRKAGGVFLRNFANFRGRLVGEFYLKRVRAGLEGPAADRESHSEGEHEYRTA